jgi:hypothetical protein
MPSRFPSRASTWACRGSRHHALHVPPQWRGYLGTTGVRTCIAATWALSSRYMSGPSISPSRPRSASSCPAATRLPSSTASRNGRPAPASACRPQAARPDAGGPLESSALRGLGLFRSSHGGPGGALAATAHLKPAPHPGEEPGCPAGLSVPTSRSTREKKQRPYHVPQAIRDRVPHAMQHVIPQQLFKPEADSDRPLGT